MRILISNDDGISAPGLAALLEAVADLGELTVVAPDSPQSAAGHAITLQHPLTVQPVHLSDLCSAAFSVDGRPADCVRLAIKQIMPSPPDLVLTGINAGANVGVNVFYSGTVAAAAEAVICGRPAVAFSASLAGGGQPDFARVAELCRWVLERLPLPPEARGLVNVNIPTLGPAKPLGVRVVHQSTAELDDRYHPHGDEPQRAYKLSDEYAFAHVGDQSDVESLAAGFITVTPLRVDMTDPEKLRQLARIDWGAPPV